MGVDEVKDPRELGTEGLTGLQSISQQLREQNRQFRVQGGSQIQRAKRAEYETALDAPVIESVGLRFPGAGTSRFDKKLTTETELSNIEDSRARVQSGVGKILNGITKGAITAGTTFLDGTLGLAMGIGQGIENLKDEDESTGFLEGLYNNSFSKAMQSVQEASEKVLPNYYTQYERENPLAASNIFSANFIGDKFLKNIGFTVGAFYSGNLASGVAKGITKGVGRAVLGLRGASATASNLRNVVNTSEAVAQLIGAGTSAINEGRIEALNTTTDWYKLQKAQLDDSYNQQLNNLYYLKRLNPKQYNEAISSLTERYDQKDKLLQENASRIGNMDLMLNMAILMPSNLFQFGKLYARGFDSYAAGIKFDKATGMFVPEQAKRSFISRAARGTADALSEGKEEVLQQIASDFSGTKYTPSNKEFFNLDFSAAEVDPATNYQTLETSKALMQTISQTLSEDSTWEQFIIGGLTGALGMPVFSKSKTGQAYLGKDKAVGLEGGLLGEIIAGNRGVNDNDEIIDKLNSRIQDPNFQTYYKGLLRHTKFENAMRAAALAGDRKTFKDSEFAQMVSDIQLFADTGQLDAYKQLLKDYASTDQDNLQSIVEITSSLKEDGSSVGPFIDTNGNQVDFEIIKKKIDDSKKSMLSTVNRWETESAILDAKFGDSINRDEKNELIWKRLRSAEAESRAISIADSYRPVLEKVAAEMNGLLQDFEDSEEYNGQPITGLDNKTADAYRESLRFTKRLLSLSNENLVRVLGKNFTTFKAILSSRLDDSNLSEDTKESLQDVLTEFNDIPKLIEDAAEYAKQYNYYSEHIDELRDKQAKEKEKASKSEENHKAEDLGEKLKNAATASEAKQTLDDSDATTSIKDKAVKNSNNPAAKEANDIQDRIKQLRTIMAGLNPNPTVYTDANTLLNGLTSQLNSVDDININNPYFANINNLPSLAGETLQQKQARLEEAIKLIANALSDVSFSTTSDSTEVAEETFDDSSAATGVSFETIGEVGGDVDSSYSGVTTVPPANSSSEVLEDAESNMLIDSYTDNESGEEHFLEKDQKEEPTDDNSSKAALATAAADQTPKDDATEIYNRPAVGKYTLGSMRIGPNGEAPKWSDTNNPSKSGEAQEAHPDWIKVNQYLTSKGAYEFIDNGSLEKYRLEGKPIYYGVDTAFDKDIVLMFAKLGEDSYQVIGSNFMSKSKTDKFQGLTALNEKVLEGAKSYEGTGLYISPISTTINSVREGRIQYSDNTRPVSEAIAATPNLTLGDIDFFVATKIGLVGSTDGIRGISNFFEKVGMSYIGVPNSNGTKSLVPIIPIDFSADILNNQDYYANWINQSLNSLTSAIISRDRLALFNSLKGVLKCLSMPDLDISLSKDGQILYLNKVDRINGRPVTIKKNGNTYTKTTNIDRIVIDSSNADAIKASLINGLVNTGARVRVYKNMLENDSYTSALINGNYVSTHAVKLNTEASWFTLNPVREEIQPSTEPVGEVKIAEDRRTTRNNRLSQLRSTKYSVQTTAPIVTKSAEELKAQAVEQLSKILPQLANVEHVRIVEKLTTDDNYAANGSIDLESSIITLARVSENGTVYHEAYHYISQLLLSDRERNSIYNEAKQIYGNLSNDALEEKLADGFRDYMLTRERASFGQRIIQWFRKLADIVTNWNFSTNNVAGLYRSIAEGRFKNKKALSLPIIKYSVFTNYSDKQIETFVEGLLLPKLGSYFNSSRQKGKLSIQDKYITRELSPATGKITNQRKVVDPNIIRTASAVLEQAGYPTNLVSFDIEQAGDRTRVVMNISVDNFRRFISDIDELYGTTSKQQQYLDSVNNLRNDLIELGYTSEFNELLNTLNYDELMQLKMCHGF